MKRCFSALILALVAITLSSCQMADATASATLLGRVTRRECPGKSLSVTCTTPQPAQAVTVIIASTSGNRYIAVTNATGGFRVDVPPGTYRIWRGVIEGVPGQTELMYAPWDDEPGDLVIAPGQKATINLRFTVPDQ